MTGLFTYGSIFLSRLKISVCSGKSHAVQVEELNAMNAYHACLVLRKKRGSNQSRVHLLILRIACF